MTLLSDRDREFVEAVVGLAYCNPFLPERVECEKRALGDEYVDLGQVWHGRADDASTPNVDRLDARVLELAEELRRRIAAGGRPGRGERRLYRDFTVYLLYSRYHPRLLRLVLDPARGTRRVKAWRDFRADFERFALPEDRADPPLGPAHLFACFFQVRRAFHLTFRHILGGSMPAARLRAAVWQSIFTHDMRRYRRSLYERMGDVTTLVTGPSGTGKELVARAVGLARYIPFDEERQAFAEDFEASFYPLNLSALSPTLIESELFGHRRGAFTGALEDRAGWLEVCPQLGTVFLDEIGEVDPAIQVKLLRVLQTRVFQRLGDTADLRFRGKIIAATNRDLLAELEAGRMREDFYYRLCSDLVVTPSLADQLRDAPDELGHLIAFLARRAAGDEEGEKLAAEVERWIERQLGRDYAWPGNVRELEQCVRNVMIRGEYRPQRPAAERGESLGALVESGALTAEEMLARYVAQVYRQTGTYQGAARRLGLDRRTVKARVEAAAESASTR